MSIHVHYVLVHSELSANQSLGRISVYLISFSYDVFITVVMLCVNAAFQTDVWLSEISNLTFNMVITSVYETPTSYLFCANDACNLLSKYP